MKINLLVLVVLFLVCQAIAESQEPDRKSEATTNALVRKGREIHAEIKKLDGHEWAGTYYAGDGLGANTSLAISPESGYVFQWHGCLGLYDQNYGAVSIVDGRLQLSFTFENKRQGFQGIAPELIPVSWGSRCYLVPADDVVGFCNEVNGGQEPRNNCYGQYLLRVGDEKRAVTGFPNVPQEFTSYLLETPIETSIDAVGQHSTRPSIVDWKFKDTPVTLNAGSRNGLRIGMELFVTSPKHAWETLRVTRVEKTRSEAVMTQIEEDEPGPEIGWRLSTQAPWGAKSKK